MTRPICDHCRVTHTVLGAGKFLVSCSHIGEFCAPMGEDECDEFSRIPGERCEWNPVRDCPATTEPGNQCNQTSTLSIGSGRSNYHVCDDCSNLPGFKRLRLRRIVRIKRGSV